MELIDSWAWYCQVNMHAGAGRNLHYQLLRAPAPPPLLQSPLLQRRQVRGPALRLVPVWRSETESQSVRQGHGATARSRAASGGRARLLGQLNLLSATWITLSSRCHDRYPHARDRRVTGLWWGRPPARRPCSMLRVAAPSGETECLCTSIWARGRGRREAGGTGLHRPSFRSGWPRAAAAPTRLSSSPPKCNNN